MNDDMSNHQPAPEFRASLEREIARAWRSEIQFSRSSLRHRPRRVAKVAGLAASALAMLILGLVLGSSTGYASAEVIVRRRGDTPLPPQAPLAVLKNIPNITSLSCIQPPRVAELPPTQQGVPIIELPVATARTTDAPLRGVLGVRETTNGGVLVNDAARRQLKLYDTTLALQSVVRDSEPGSATSYGSAMVPLIRYLGDSSLISDNESGTFLVLGPTGRVARAFAPTGMEMRFGMQVGPGAVDDKGRLIYSWRPLTDIMRPRIPGAPDSETVFRADLDTRRVDTLARIRGTGSMGLSTRDGVTRVYAEPIASVDNFAQLSDGSIAIVRGNDYHVDWILPDGSKWSTPKLPFDWKRMTDEEKLRLIDSTAEAVLANVQRRSAGGAPSSPGSGDVATRLEALRGLAQAGGVPGGGEPDPGAVQRKYEFVRPELKDLPEYFPAIRPRASVPDLEGNLWILPTSSAQSKRGELVYDVVNAKGEFHRVRFPVGRSLAGFGKGGVVFMLAGDKTNGFWIEKTRLPSKK